MTATDQTSCDLTVYFDGSCPICRREIAVYQRAKGADRIAFLDVSRPDAALPPELDAASAMARFHVKDDQGQLRSGADGFAALWLTLPRWRWLGRVVRVRPILALAEFTYLRFLALRPRLHRLMRRG